VSTYDVASNKQKVMCRWRRRLTVKIVRSLI